MSAYRSGCTGGGGPPKGQLLNGVWYCDCNPRLPAVHFETKKEGPNKGKWFRRCTRPQGEQCKFFLWDHDAQPWERDALANNSQTEPGPANPAPTTPATSSRRPPSPPPPYATETNPSTSSRKRSRPINDDFDDEYSLGQVDDDNLSQVTVAAETPRKAARTTNFTTPTPKTQNLPWQMDWGGSSSNPGLPTPQTEQRFPRANPFASTPGSALFKPTSTFNADGSQQSATPSSSFETHTPSRFQRAMNEDVVKDVFDILKNGGVRLPERTEEQLRTLLVQQTKNAEGYKRGRDLMRITVKAKEAKITELTHRINTLEAELEAEKATAEHLRWEAGNESDY